MGALCEQVIALAAKSLSEGDIKTAKKIFPLDDEIDQKERDIESMCLKMLLQQQPVARDLRQISAALKMITDMERIGDQASDIAEMVCFVNSACLTGKVHIADMAKATIKMVTQSVDSFVKSDADLARSAIALDDTVDNLFLKVKGELIESVKEGQSDAEALIDLLMIAKYFERIGDHAENIAQWVIYSLGENA